MWLPDGFVGLPYLLAHQDKHTLLKRDILNVTKQDDGAAYQMFYLDNLLQIIQAENISNMIRLFIYLFILESIEPQMEIENVRTAALEVSQLMLDKSDDESNIRNENKVTNILLATFSNLRYIFSQKPVSQKQFESIFNKQAQPETSETTEKSGLLNLNNTNRLITELTIDLNIQENCRNQRKECWEGRK
ncbi:hypothetical protein C1646_665731 [Rhizophagus diaphanus]|nr:hypothetical protein C1646_665731 [Rhizophagus diaphanus] [Rhizophagus sp. MUCL 43196]